jgi:hypothetical protein
MTSRITRTGKAGFLVGILAAIAGPVAAAQPQDVSIVAHTERGCPTPASCVFVATGAITDGGMATTDLVHVAALPSPVVGTAQYLKTFHGVMGSLTIRLDSMIKSTNDPTLWDEQGNWVIVSGTGAYAGLLGEGSESGIRDFEHQSLDAEYTGQVH